MDKDLKQLWANALAGKMPKNERVFLSDPKFAYLYAKYIRKKRWDEKDEVIFHSDMKCCYLYCVFMGKPPEHLHNFMIAKSLEDLDDIDKRWIDEYFNFLKSEVSENKN